MPSFDAHFLAVVFCIEAAKFRYRLPLLLGLLLASTPWRRPALGQKISQSAGVR